MDLPIEVDRDLIAEFCRKHHLTKFAFFGSLLSDRFGPDSDIDVLFDYDQNYSMTLFGVVRMEREISDLLGRKVDMRTAEDLSRYFRDEVVQNALVQYAA